jgi:hypothetical protein
MGCNGKSFFSKILLLILTQLCKYIGRVKDLYVYDHVSTLHFKLFHPPLNPSKFSTISHSTEHWMQALTSLWPKVRPRPTLWGGGGGSISLSTPHTLHISISPSDLHFSDTRYSTFVLLMHIVCWRRFSYLPTSAHSLRLYVNIFRPSHIL